MRRNKRGRTERQKSAVEHGQLDGVGDAGQVDIALPLGFVGVLGVGAGAVPVARRRRSGGAG